MNFNNSRTHNHYQLTADPELMNSRGGGNSENNQKQPHLCLPHAPSLTPSLEEPGLVGQGHYVGHDPGNASDRKQRILSTATEFNQTVLPLFLDCAGGQQHFSDSDDCSLVRPGDFPEFFSATSSQKIGKWKFVCL